MGIRCLSFSNGGVYGDLDNDGDLDVVINNINGQAFVYENTLNKKNQQLTVRFVGAKNNEGGIGATLRIYYGDNQQQYYEHYPTRGYLSTDDNRAHFGLGDIKKIDSLLVSWPDGKEQIINNPRNNSLLVADYSKAKDELRKTKPKESSFKDITDGSGIAFTHEEDLFDDYIFEPLLPHRYSMMGPALVKGDVNNDGLEDFFIGNASGKVSKLYVQNSDSKFIELAGPWVNDSIYEDVGATFSDFDNDGDLDLYVASHGNAFQDHTDRLYINLGTHFIKAVNALPKETVAGKCISVNDFDKDGLKDIFIGSRNTPGKYPYPSSSMLLKNVGGKNEALRFENVSNSLAKDLNDFGMVTNAVWKDLDGDSWDELIITGEWMPITIFKNDKGQLENNTEEFGLEDTEGWWYAVKLLDVDIDGDLDIVAGNLGLNYKYQASADSPFMVYSTDFDENGTNDIVFSYKKEGKDVPLRGRECSSQQVPAIAKRYDTYRAYALADLDDIYGANILEDALNYKVESFAHAWFENENGKFSKRHNLPRRAQFSAINDIETIDYNGDEYPDLLVAGNVYQAEVETPRGDAGIGLVLVGSPEGFKVIEPYESGLFLEGDVKSIAPINLVNGSHSFLLGTNNETLKLVEFSK